MSALTWRRFKASASKSPLIDQYERRASPGGDPYYWPSGHGLDFHATEPGSDVDALMARAITVTPLTYDLTAHRAMDKWSERLGRT